MKLDEVNFPKHMVT